MTHCNYSRERIAKILQEIDRLRMRGETLQQAAAHAGISSKTYYSWREKHPDIVKANKALFSRQKSDFGISSHVEQAIIKLREIDYLYLNGKSIEQAVKRSGITMETYYRWREKYGWMTLEDADKLHRLEEENEKLKNLVDMWRNAFGPQTVRTLNAENPRAMT